jgi:hypothetical protein
MNTDPKTLPTFHAKHVYVDDATSGFPILRFQRNDVTIEVKISAEAAEVLAEVLAGTARASRVTGWGRPQPTGDSAEIRGYLDAQLPLDGEPLPRGGVSAVAKRIFADAPHIDPEHLWLAIDNRLRLRRALRAHDGLEQEGT